MPEEGGAFDDAAVNARADILNLEGEDATDEVWFIIDVFVARHGWVRLAEVLEVVLADELFGGSAESIDIEVCAAVGCQEKVVVLAVDARETSIEL